MAPRELYILIIQILFPGAKYPKQRSTWFWKQNHSSHDSQSSESVWGAQQVNAAETSKAIVILCCSAIYWILSDTVFVLEVAFVLKISAPAFKITYILFDTFIQKSCFLDHANKYFSGRVNQHYG